MRVWIGLIHVLVSHSFVPSVPQARRRLAWTSIVAKQSTSYSPTEQEVRPPLTKFRDEIEDRLAHANGISLDPAASQGKDPNVCVIDFLDLMSMAFASSTTQEMQERRESLVQKMQTTGGYCIVRFTDDIETGIVNDMWTCLEGFFQGETSRKTIFEEEANDNWHFGHQALTRNETVHDTTGYNYVQTTARWGEILPDNLADLPGGTAESPSQALKAYQLLSQLCKAFASVVYSGSTGSTPKESSDLISSLLDEPDRPFCASYHRLCQYLQLLQGDESLRSHTDWTLATCIPISSIVGLECFTGQEWILPEVVAQGLYERSKAAGSVPDETEDSQVRWHSSYVVVMAGNWLEILTQEQDRPFEPTIHRVVSQDATVARPSAPFFMRPREIIFDRADKLFGQGSSADTHDGSSMSDFLRFDPILHTR